MKKIFCFLAAGLLVFCCACAQPTTDGNSSIPTVPDIEYDETVTVKVPDLVGLNFEKAMEKHGKDVMLVAEWEYNDSNAYGTVFEQDKTAGSEVKQGTVVNIKISKGKKPTASSSGSASSKPASSKPSGSTSSGGNYTGSGVEGEKYVTMADVTNITTAQAIVIIDNLGLKVGTITKAANAVYPEGYVLHQSKQEGMLLQKGSVVDLIVTVKPNVGSGVESGSVDF
jgi:beta-lactam-binding protein with PASTA domain